MSWAQALNSCNMGLNLSNQSSGIRLDTSINPTEIQAKVNSVLCKSGKQMTTNYMNNQGVVQYPNNYVQTSQYQVQPQYYNYAQNQYQQTAQPQYSYAYQQPQYTYAYQQPQQAYAATQQASAQPQTATQNLQTSYNA